MQKNFGRTLSLPFTAPAEKTANQTGDFRGHRKPETKTKQKNQKHTMAVKIRPLGDRVLVRPIEETEVKKGGIIIPDTAKEKPQEGEVVALGTGKRDENGKLIEFTVKKGDKVIISKYGGTEVKLDGVQHLIMREDDILGIIG
jgi:chaperonin GroES